ncbi:P-loop NTPase family protein [Botryobacter ruber]|uniref:ATPase n=1 Tax=Botryobacter ruber TaxID=2171629 RepID=UPI001F0C5B46|nr:ATPase [Botryobacter ruber]
MQAIREIVQQSLPQATGEKRKTTANPSEAVVEAAVNQQRDLGRCLALLERKGKELYGEHFRLHEEDQPLLGKLLSYMIGDREQAERQGLSLRKGILLIGPTGCGKTSLMTLLRLFTSPDECYRVKSCREVSFEFHREGYEVIQRFSQGIVWSPSRKPGGYCFDDLGAESSLRYYGNMCNVMGEVLLSRYDLFVSQGVKTHLTTNLTSSEMEKTYGSRVRSRMREMFNLVSFEKEARDKRR